jgi:hypothetical protein
MKRVLAILSILLFGLLVLSPVLRINAVASAETVCADGSLPDTNGKCICTDGSKDGSTQDAAGNCVCPSGNLAEDDGTCSVSPFAQACQGNASTASTCKTDGTKNPVSGKDGVIFKAINIFSIIIGIASVIMILFGGLRYVISNGDSNGISTAKNTILYAVIGIVVFLLSRGILAFVINKL